MIKQLNHPNKKPWEKKTRVRVLRVHKAFRMVIYECVFYKKGEKKKDWEQRTHFYYDAKSGFCLCNAWDIWNQTKSTRQLKKRLQGYVEESKEFFKTMYPEVSEMTVKEYFKWKIERETRRFMSGERRY